MYLSVYDGLDFGKAIFDCSDDTAGPIMRLFRVKRTVATPILEKVKAACTELNSSLKAIHANLIWPIEILDDAVENDDEEYIELTTVFDWNVRLNDEIVQAGEAGNFLHDKQGEEFALVCDFVVGTIDDKPLGIFRVHSLEHIERPRQRVEGMDEYGWFYNLDSDASDVRDCDIRSTDDQLSALAGRYAWKVFDGIADQTIGFLKDNPSPVTDEHENAWEQLKYDWCYNGDTPVFADLVSDFIEDKVQALPEYVLYMVWVLDPCRRGQNYAPENYGDVISDVARNIHQEIYTIAENEYNEEEHDD